jgi:predicted kinase
MNATTLSTVQIVVIGGLPCSGKTKVANALRSRFRWPVLCKDEVKEKLFDSVGTAGRDWSRKLSVAAYEIMFAQAHELARCGVTFAMEGNFRDEEQSARFADLLASGVVAVQVHCRAETEVLVERFRHRATTSQRHVGHVDSESLPDIERELRASSQRPLNLPGVLIECDTSRDWEGAIELAMQRIASVVGPSRSL